MSTDHPQCQVRQRIEKWPYVALCKNLATHTVNEPFKSFVDGIEYLCSKHTKEMIDGYGEASVNLIEYKIDGDTLRIDTGSNSGPSKEDQLID